MAVFWPAVAMDNVTDITLRLLRTMDVDGLILDVDNTLACHGSQTPFEGAVEWVRQLVENGIKIVIVSNNFKKRVAPFAKQFELPFISFATKPFPFGYLRAVRKMGLAKERTAVVGDQLFTDILGANLLRMKSILLVPREQEQSFSFRLRRKWEQPIRQRFLESGGGRQYFE